VVKKLWYLDFAGGVITMNQTEQPSAFSIPM
jgi:hypothetical protein